VKPFRVLVEALRKRHGERRFYYRVYNFNGPGWRKVREAAEPCRDSVLHLFNQEALDTFLPPPDETVSFDDDVADASGRKTILGLMLWAKEHL
jgi:asparagine synthase (glutamine-hydrolysing)